MNKKLLLIVNPCSGKAKMKSELLRVVQIFASADYDVTVYPTKARGDATVKTRQLKENEFDLVVVCGGDGTLNEAIAGLLETGVKVNIGYIPAGTLNEWSSGLGISKNIRGFPLIGEGIPFEKRQVWYFQTEDLALLSNQAERQAECTDQCLTAPYCKSFFLRAYSTSSARVRRPSLFMILAR